MPPRIGCGCFGFDGWNDDKIWIHDRKTGELAGSIGDNGRMAGQFHWIDAIAMDSQGNLYRHVRPRGFEQPGFSFAPGKRLAKQ